MLPNPFPPTIIVTLKTPSKRAHCTSMNVYMYVCVSECVKILYVCMIVFMYKCVYVCECVFENCICI